MRKLQWCWWFIISIALLPAAYFLLFSSMLFGFLEKKFTAAFCWLCDFKHKIAKTPEVGAYQQGKEAFHCGYNISLNPYDELDAQYDEWRGGWMDEYAETK